MSRNAPTTTAKKVSDYRTLMPLLSAMFDQFKEASKKKPDTHLNKKKIEIVNRLVAGVLTILEGEPERPYLELLDEESLPQNSDVVLILGQTVAAMEAFKRKYCRREDEDDVLSDPIWMVAHERKAR